MLLSGVRSTPWVLVCFAIASAQGQIVDERPRVTAEDSNEAVRQLRLLDAYVDQGSWVEAADMAQQIIETYPHQVLALPDERPVRYVSIRTACQRRLVSFPADALAQYRDRVDPQAAALLEEAEQTRDGRLLARVADEFFASSSGDAAAEKLGDRDLALGNVDSAIAWWSRLIPLTRQARQEDAAGLWHPDPKNDMARLTAKWTIAQLLRNDLPAAERGLKELKETYANAGGELAGKDDTYWKIVQDFGRDTEARAAAIPSADWLTFGGNPSRGKVAPRSIRLGTIQHRWLLTDATTLDDLEPQEMDFDPRFLPFRQAIRPPTPEGPHIHPVTVGKEVFVSDGNFLHCFQVDKEKSDYSFNLVMDQPGPQARGSSPSRHTLTVAGPLLFARTGGTSTAPVPQVPNSSLAAKSRLFCFDHAERRLLWWKNATVANLGQQLVFEGAPICKNGKVYIGAHRLDAMSTTYVLCLDAQTGELDWSRLVCEATNDWESGFNPDQNLLAMADETLYCCTNLGAVAAIDITLQKVKWLAEYERDNERGVGAPDVNPCVVHQGRVFAMPGQSQSILCLSAETGRTLWKRRLSVQHILGVASGLLIVTGDRVYGIDVATGDVVWRYPENQPKGVGRGMLAGNYVYWPTATEIHVLDQATGRRAEAPVGLIEGLRAKPGNLIPGDGYALLAQNKQVLVIRPQQWLREERERLVAEDPSSATARFLLAESVRAEGDLPAAADRYLQASELATETEVHTGRPLRTLALERRCDVLIDDARARAEGLASSREPTLREEISGLLATAIESAPDLERRWQAIDQQASFWQAQREPARAIACYRDALADAAFAQHLTESKQGRGWPTHQLIGARIESLRQENPDIVAQEWDRPFDAQAQDSTAESAMLLVRHFPAARGASRWLIGLGQELLGQERFDDAVLIASAALDQSKFDDSARVESLVLLDETLAKLGWSNARPRVWDQMASVGDRTFRGPGHSTVAEYVSLRREERRQEEETYESLTPSWTTRDENVQIVVPAGDAPGANVAGVIVADEGGWSYCDAATGARRWVAPNAAFVPPSAWYSLAGLLTSEQNEIVCRSYRDGKARWTYRLDEPVAGEPSASLRPSATALVDEPFLHLLSGGRIVTLDLVNGQVARTVDPIEAWGKLEGGSIGPHLQKIAGVLLTRTGERVFAVDEKGTLAWTMPMLHHVPYGDAVEIGGAIVLVTGRAEVSAVEPGTGRLLWQRRTTWPSWDLPHLYARGNVLLLLVDSYQLSRLDPRTGEPLWETGVSTSPAKGLGDQCTLTGEYFLVGSRNGLDCLRTGDGRLAWHVQPGATDAFRVRSGHVEAVTTGSEGRWLSAWSVETGQSRGKVSLPSLGSEARIAWTGSAAVISGASASVGIGPKPGP